MGSTSKWIDNSNSKTTEVSEASAFTDSKSTSKHRSPVSASISHSTSEGSHSVLPRTLASDSRKTSFSRQGRALPTVHRKIANQLNLSTSSGRQQFDESLQTRDRVHISDRTDALWAEMQATLEEVEMSASGDTRVFGAEHVKELINLRSSQIALAQAWARSEADDAIESAIQENSESGIDEYIRNHRIVRPDGQRPDVGDAADVAKRFVEIARNKSEPGIKGAEGLALQLEEETELDILLAGRRRQANDDYFQRVNKGVIDVVSKLDDVATAMRSVEQESKDIWNEASNKKTY
ncbi:hypothetical protein CDD80_592 [Ophiocordyceps camponoti-rufipedis]|uniref:Uncharacterized protein n=1 Tax=Ophiocordyceps camponoti-rufipedis TaxID=2004952 RepID=A0A2C5YL96_9HYPO|nr:hypothetical protein CDD80_592 [Ophiocordyceps camponoti-rufipedis]